MIESPEFVMLDCLWFKVQRYGIPKWARLCHELAMFKKSTNTLCYGAKGKHYEWNMCKNSAETSYSKYRDLMPKHRAQNIDVMI